VTDLDRRTDPVQSAALASDAERLRRVAARVLGNAVTVHDHRGRVVGVDVTSGRILANLTMRE
jgi:hypothetical protein